MKITQTSLFKKDEMKTLFNDSSFSLKEHQKGVNHDIWGHYDPDRHHPAGKEVGRFFQKADKARKLFLQTVADSSMLSLLTTEDRVKIWLDSLKKVGLSASKHFRIY